MKSILSTIFITGLLASCSTIDQPDGSSKGYLAARFAVTPNSSPSGPGLEDSPEVNGVIQEAIGKQFQSHGISFGSSETQLIVAYMLIRQDNVSTTMNNDYFGYGRDSIAILDEAHERGVIKNKRPDEFEAGAIVIDILDAKDNQLIYRHFAKRDLLEGADTATRNARINEAVAEALEPFFR